MHLDWIMNPLVPYAIVAAAMIAFLALGVSFKAEIAAISRKAETADATNRELEQQLEHMRETLGQLRRDATANPEPVKVPAGRTLNLTKRSQALRMHHRGEAVATIAAALEAPHNEIELLLKLQQTIQQRRN